jgi:hypothetical protein
VAEFVLRGMLVEYSGQFLGPIPNVVVFQFNPESIARTVAIPQRAEGSGAERPQQERGQAAAPPTETFTLTAHFSAADDLGAGGALSAIPRVFGIGPQLAALEKMVYPPRTPGGLLGAAIDAVASALSSGSEGATRSVPREQVPRVLFIWGPSRVLPVTITSLTLTEQKFDALLNPVQAQVQIGIAVASQPPDDDAVAKGALEYSNMIKDTQATLNLAKAVELALDIVPF